MVRIRSLLENLAIAVSLAGVLPVYLYLDLPTQIIFPGALLLGAWGDRRQEHVLSPRIATIVSVVVFVVYAARIDSEYLVEPALNIIVLLLAVRLLTEKEGRHFLQIFLLAGFALAGSSLMTLSLAFLPLMILLVSGIIAGLVFLCFYRDEPGLVLDRADFYKVIRVCLALPAGAFLLALFFFFILPRTQHPLWDFLNPGGTAKVGFSDEVRPGTFSSTVAGSTIAFRVEAPEMDPNELYWRVTVLDRLEGTTWKRSYRATRGSPNVSGGKIFRVTMFPEANQGKYLATLDTPESIRGVYNRRRSDGVFRYYRTAKRPQSYEVESRLNGRLKIDENSDPAKYLELPPDIAPKARLTARELIGDADTEPSAKIERVKDFFRQQQLIYATENLPTGGDAVDTFLFDSKRGYCEYFASAFAVMLREVGVPARLVGGYLGGEYNQLGGYYSVGEKTAHVWVEALSGEGFWERIDPNLYAVNAEGALLERSRQRRLGWLQLSDAIEYYWIQLVITLDFSRQLDFVRSVRDQVRDWRHGNTSRPSDYGWILVFPVLIVLFFYLRNYKSRSKEEKLLHDFTRAIDRETGTERTPPNIGLFEMAHRSTAPQAREFARVYGGAIYRDRRLNQDEIKRLKELLRSMKNREPS